MGKDNKLGETTSKTRYDDGWGISPGYVTHINVQTGPLTSSTYSGFGKSAEDAEKRASKSYEEAQEKESARAESESSSSDSSDGYDSSDSFSSGSPDYLKDTGGCLALIGIPLIFFVGSGLYLMVKKSWDDVTKHKRVYNYASQTEMRDDNSNADPNVDSSQLELKARDGTEYSPELKAWNARRRVYYEDKRVHNHVVPYSLKDSPLEMKIKVGLEMKIKVGDRYNWINPDPIDPTPQIVTLTSESGTELDSRTLSKGQTYSHTFTETGTYFMDNSYNRRRCIVIVE